MRCHPVCKVLLGLVLAAGTAACGGRDGPFPPTGYYVDPTDGRRMTVLVEWTGDGYCAGQFDVDLQERQDAVVVAAVTTEQRPEDDCAGLGASGEAQAHVVLQEPLGDRAVRNQDGSRIAPRALP